MDLAAKFEKTYVGKKVLGYDFIITAAGIAGAVKEFGEQAVNEFFCDGKIANNGKRTVVDALREKYHAEEVNARVKV